MTPLWRHDGGNAMSGACLGAGRRNGRRDALRQRHRGEFCLVSITTRQHRSAGHDANETSPARQRPALSPTASQPTERAGAVPDGRSGDHASGESLPPIAGRGRRAIRCHARQCSGEAPAVPAVRRDPRRLGPDSAGRVVVIGTRPSSPARSRPTTLHCATLQSPTGATPGGTSHAADHRPGVASNIDDERPPPADVVFPDDVGMADPQANTRCRSGRRG
jgi:hypothetical protein